MNAILVDQIRQSLVKVMKTMFNIKVEVSSDSGRDVADLSHGRSSRISFSGQISGSMVLVVDGQLINTMAENFMGSQPDGVTDDLANSTLKEALNMVAGDALTAMDKQAYTSLGIPETLDLSRLPANGEWVVFSSGPHLLAAALFMS